MTSEVLRFLEAYYRIANNDTRRELLGLVKSVAASGEFS